MKQSTEKDGRDKALSAEEFAALMEPFGLASQSLALAVSGGPDSMALALSLKNWNCDSDAQIRCFIVDHGLRPESGDEATTVKERLKKLELEAKILRWEHPPVNSRVHILARKARYELLVEACKKYGIRHLLLAHHRDDQAETILMRFAKGSGIDGLAGMASLNERNGVILVRPLLAVAKDRLVATCEAAGVAYVTDPSNAKEKYARGRLRKVQQALAEEGFATDRLIDLGARAREAKEALDHYTQDLLREAVQMDSAGVICLDREKWNAAPQAVALRALGRCLQTIHRTDYQPERALLVPLAKALRKSEPMGARTLHGCMVSKTAAHITIVREFAAINDEKTIEPGQTVLWDGRWKVSLALDCGEKGLVVRALGVQPHEILDRLAPGLRKLVPQGRSRGALPALWRGNALVFIPACLAKENEAFCSLISLTS